MATWNWLDWILIGVVLASIAAAAYKGFIRELIALAALVAALVIAALAYGRAAAWFEDLTSSHAIALGAGFLSLFLGTLVAGALASAAAKKLVQTAGLQVFDRVLGGIFGLVRGVAIDSVLLMVFVAFAIKSGAVQQSVLAPYVANGARVIVLAMPHDIKDQFHVGFEQFHKALIQRDKEAVRN
jgi:membrane protein required for colicin V production